MNAAAKGQAALDAVPGGGRAASRAGGGLPPAAAGLSLLHLVEIMRWCGRVYLVKVGLDPEGGARAVSVQMIGPRPIGTDMDSAALAMNAQFLAGKTAPELAVEWPEDAVNEAGDQTVLANVPFAGAVARLVAEVNRIEAASGWIIRRAFR